MRRTFQAYSFKRFTWLAEVMIFHILKACQARHAKGDMRYRCAGKWWFEKTERKFFYGKVGILIVNFARQQLLRKTATHSKPSRQH